MLESAAPSIAAPESNAKLSHEPSISSMSISLATTRPAPSVFSTSHPGSYELFSEGGSSCPPAGTIGTPVAALAENSSVDSPNTGASIPADSTHNDEISLERLTGEGHEEATFEPGDNIPVRIPSVVEFKMLTGSRFCALHRPPSHLSRPSQIRPRNRKAWVTSSLART